MLRLVCVIFWLCVTNADELRLEVENFPGVDVPVSRSNASNGMVAHLVGDDIIQYYMCVHSPTDILISNILFSDITDQVDVVSVFIDGNKIGSFNSRKPEIAQVSSDWNDIRSSGQVGDVVSLDYGRHLLQLHVINADSFGIEIDAIDLDIRNFSIRNRNFACEKYCFDDIKYPYIQSPKGKERFKIRQHSIATVCSEEENVRVGFYHDSAKSFEIKATRPKYESCANNRDTDFRGCKLASPAWKFKNVILNPDTSVTRKTHRADLTVDNTENLARVGVVFDMAGFSVTRGQGESRTAGSLFTLFGNISANNPVTAALSYTGQSGRLETIGEHVFDVDNPSHTWNIPDDTWDFDDNNNIILTVRNLDNDFTDLYLEEMRLEKRRVHSRTVTMADDGKYVFEGIYEEPKQSVMSINVNDGTELRSYDEVASLRLYMKKPYANGFSQIFVIDNNGHTRIQPVTPHGMDWTPFGSSFVIGPNRSNSKRPSAPIKSIQLKPSDMLLNITYIDGSSVDLRILPNASETTMTLDDYMYGEGRKRSHFALITFLSTWIEDGFAYVDRMAVDGNETANILEDFNELTGNRVNFYRKCISRLNTQSPDIEVLVKDTGGVQ